MRIVLCLALALLAAMPARAQGTDPADLAFWQSIQNSKEPAEYQAYLQAFPNGRFAPLARVRAGQAAGAAPAGPVATPAPIGPLPAMPAAPQPAAAAAGGAMDAMAFSHEAAKLQRAGLFAKYRGKTLEIRGRFQKLVDTTIGEAVHFEFILPEMRFGPRFTISCTFPRRDTKAYDAFATMRIGTWVTVRGQIYDVMDTYASVMLQPCAVIDPPLHGSAIADARDQGPATPPLGLYSCRSYGDIVLGGIQLLPNGTYNDSQDRRGRYSVDASGRVTFHGKVFNETYVGRYIRPGSPAQGASTTAPTIMLAPASSPANETIICDWKA